jgi:hypothetical protein
MSSSFHAATAATLPPTLTAPRPQPLSLARRRRQERLARLLKIAETAVGKGLFARRRLKADMVIGEIEGEIFPDYPKDPSYCMELPSGKLLEPAPPLRFLNHSCDPNCELFYWEAETAAEQEDRLFLQTLRDIEPGEELLIDYGWPADAAIPCRCGADCCRGWIVDPEQRHLIPGLAGSSPCPSPEAHPPTKPR